MAWRSFGRFNKRLPSAIRQKRLSEDAIFRVVFEELRSSIRISKHRWQRHTDFEYLKPFIEAARQRAESAEANRDQDGQAAAWLLALVLQAPKAALAQAKMDKHKHSFRNKSARVMELIDFNDAYVSTVLAMPGAQIHDFNNQLKSLIDWFCKRVGAWTLSNAQFEAISHGLSREIAVFNAVKTSGFKVEMANRAGDAFGIDMRITDPETNKQINIDTKTTSAFRYRLIDLLREGRLSQDDIDLADRRGFTAVMNGHGDEKVRVILWRINQADLGEIIDFAFQNPASLIDQLGLILAEYGEVED